MYPYYNYVMLKRQHSEANNIATSSINRKDARATGPTEGYLTHWTAPANPAFGLLPSVHEHLGSPGVSVALSLIL